MSSCKANLVSGLLSELAALGHQDQYLYCSPQETLFAQAYSRITNFAMGEQDVDLVNAPEGVAGWSARSVSAEIQRSGDLLCDVYFKCRLSALDAPSIPSAGTTVLNLWTPAVGFALLQKVYLEVGSQEVESYTSEYMMMHDEVHRAEGKRQGLQVGDYGLYLRDQQIAGNIAKRDSETILKGVEFSTRAQDLNIQLPFHFADHPGNALNVVGLQYHNINVKADLRAAADLAMELTITDSTGAIAVNTLNTQSISEIGLRCIFVHLDTAERRVRAQQPVTMMFVKPQIQEIQVAAGSVNFESRNYFNHPIIDLLWAYRSADKTNVTTAGSQRREWFNFGAYSALKNNISGAALSDQESQEVFDAIEIFDLKTNSHGRICGRSAYFRQAIPRARSARQPTRMVSQYSFAYNPTDMSRPTGSLNLSRIDNVVLTFTLRATGTTTREMIGTLGSGDGAISAGSVAGNIFLCARSINFYRQAGGMLGIMFAN